MSFTELTIPGAWVIDLQPIEDDRGWFVRSFSAAEFTSRGMNPAVLQCNLSFNAKRGTLRGMHYQLPPHAEAKFVRCTAGAVHDVVLDVRPDSPTFGRWEAVRLDPVSRRQIYIPEGCAHGFQALEDGSEIFYQISAEYRPDAGRGVRWNDPRFGIRWPIEPPTVISPRDAAYADWA